MMTGRNGLYVLHLGRLSYTSGFQSETLSMCKFIIMYSDLHGFFFFFWGGGGVCFAFLRVIMLALTSEIMNTYYNYTYFKHVKIQLNNTNIT